VPTKTKTPSKTRKPRKTFDEQLREELSKLSPVDRKFVREYVKWLAAHRTERKP
jgi:hypothetical protein